MKKILLLTAAVLAIQALPALAEDGGQHKGGKGMHVFELQDADKDGAVSKEEFMKFNEGRFAEIDANGDGKVTKEEVKAHHEAMRAKWEAKKKEMKEQKEKEADSAPEEAPPAAE